MFRLARLAGPGGIAPTRSAAAWAVRQATSSSFSSVVRPHTGAAAACSSLRLAARRAVAAPRPLARAQSSVAAEAAVGASAPASYGGTLKATHWLMAGGTLFCFGTVQVGRSFVFWRVGCSDLAVDQRKRRRFQVAMNTKGSTKGQAMMLHKSMGLLLLGAILIRIPIRMSTKIPAKLPGNVLEHMAANASHFTMYTMMILMPVSGVRALLPP
jgi:hypothetical protein